jgi:hypothetical protein
MLDRSKMRLLDGRFAVAHLPAASAVPAWAAAGGFTSITRTDLELSVVCLQEHLPPDAEAECDWRCLQVVGPLSFQEVGILASLLRPLSEAGIPVFAISTFNTDYLLVKAADIERSLAALRAAGHEILQ